MQCLNQVGLIEGQRLAGRTECEPLFYFTALTGSIFSSVKG